MDACVQLGSCPCRHNCCGRIRGYGVYSPFESAIDPKSHESLLPALIRGLKRLDPTDVTDRVASFLNHSQVAVRMAALEAVQITDNDVLRRRILALVGDRSDEVRELAIEKIKDCPYCNGKLLFEFLYPASWKNAGGYF